MNRNQKELKTIRGRRGSFDEASLFDLGLLPPTRTRPHEGTLEPQQGTSKTKSKSGAFTLPEPEPEETIWEVASQTSVTALDLENELVDGKKPPISRFVYEEYVYGEKGTEPSGAAYTYKEEYEYEKPRKEILRPATAPPPVKSRYMDHYEGPGPSGASRPYTARPRTSRSRRSVPRTAQSKAQAEAIKEFEDAIRFEALIDEVEEEIIAQIEYVEGEHGSQHAMLGDVEVSPRFDLRSFLGLKYPMTPDRLKQPAAPPAKRVYTAGVNALPPPKSYEQVLKYYKHNKDNKQLYEKIKKVQSSYNRDKLLSDYERAKASIPEGRFPQPKSTKLKAKATSSKKSKSGTKSKTGPPSHPFASFWTRPMTATHIVGNHIDFPGTGMKTHKRPLTAVERAGQLDQLQRTPYEPYYFGGNHL